LGGQAQWSWPPRPRCLNRHITMTYPEDREEDISETVKWQTADRKYHDNGCRFDKIYAYPY
ncbi:MAG: hypothetical protein K2J00_05055, partial [Bacteroidaceae bacterium]|nr:hypothetical protein [Bacteroidaceae bacterium]